MNIISNSVLSKQCSKSFKLTYFQSRAINPPDKLILGSNQYDIKPGFQIIIPKNTLYSVISSDPHSYRIYKKTNIIDIKAPFGINIIKKTISKNKGLFKNDSIFKDSSSLRYVFLYRLFSIIPIPGIDQNQLYTIINSNENRLLDLFNVFTGGITKRISLLALGIIPFYTSLIIIRLFSIEINPLPKQLILVLILVICSIQSYTFSIGLESRPNLVNYPGLFFRLTTILLLSTTTLFFSWFILYQFQDQWKTALLLVIIMTIISELPYSHVNFEFTRTGKLSGLSILIYSRFYS